MAELIEKLRGLKAEFSEIAGRLTHYDEFRIGQAYPREAVEIAELYRDNFPEHILVKRGVLSDPEKIVELLKDERKIWISVRVDGNLVGCSALEVYEWNNAAELQRGVTKHEYRGRGVGREMHKARLSIAEKIGASFVYAYVRSNAHGSQTALRNLGFSIYGIAPMFYVSHGGREVRENFVFMGKIINEGEVEKLEENFIPDAKRLKEVLDEINLKK